MESQKLYNALTGTIHLCRVSAADKQIRLRERDIIPLYPRGHAFVVRQVQTVKRTILKCRNLALLALRPTPLSSNVASPADLQNGRAFKSTLPGKIYPSKGQLEFRNWLKARQDNQSRYYNRNTKVLPELNNDQANYVQDPVKKTWNPARVIDQGDTPRSYVVQTETGAQLQRNRIHLRPSNWSNNPTNNSSNDIPQGSTTTPKKSSDVDSQDPVSAETGK